MTNQQIAKILRDVAASYTIKNEKKYPFQIIAYQKAADSIENLNKEVEELYREDKLGHIPAVGAAIKEHIIEFLKTGKVKHFESIMKGIPKTVFPLMEIPTFGPKKAFKLAKAFKLKDEKTVIADLENIAKKGKIEELSGFGKKSQDDILKAIEEYIQGRAKTTRMVLPYADELAQKIIGHLKEAKDVIQAHPLGSLRRMLATVGDIDIAVSSKNPKNVIEHFISYPGVVRVIEKGPSSASIIVDGGKQSDLMVKPPESFGALLQHFTGSKNHNIALREYALKKGFSLSEYGIKKKLDGKWKELKFDTEEKFYDALGMDWIPPEIREDKGEIQLALSHNLPELIELKDLKGDLHIHSSFPIEPSHDAGRSTPEEIVKKAISLGYEYVGFAEHNPSLSTHTKAKIKDILKKRKEFFQKLQEKYQKIRILTLLEVDILANGQLAIEEESFSTLDAAIVSVHSSFNLAKKEMTKRILEGLSHPKAKILGHPTGRMLGARTGYDLNFEEIFDFCKKNNKALEINAWPNRLDLPDSLVFEAVKRKVKMVIDSDSHEVNQMDLMRYGVSVARRGWAEKNDILNAEEYNKFIDWLKS